MFRDIVRGVAHLHSIGIAHRDLSFDTILVNEDVECFIGGFSFASKHGQKCKRLVHRTFYTAPEVIGQTENYNGFQADVWSLGIVLLVMAIGAIAFVHASSTDKNYQHYLKIGVRQFILNRNLVVPEAIIDLLEAILQVDPENRPSAAELLQHPLFHQKKIVAKKLTPSLEKKSSFWSKMWHRCSE